MAEELSFSKKFKNYDGKFLFLDDEWGLNY